jgi:hypothetical protein
MDILKKTIRVAGAVIAIALLSGCIVSKGALFDPKQGVKPLAAGRYQSQDYVVGNWIDRASGRLKIDGSNYIWSEKPDDETDEGMKFTLHDIGGGLFVAMIESQGQKYDHAYDLLQVSDDGVLEYNVSCDSVPRVLGIDSSVIKKDGWQCFVPRVGDLIKLFRAYGKRSFPAKRYVWQGEQ